MAFYTNKNQTSSLAAVEFSPRPEGNLTFFHARDSAGKEKLKAQIAAFASGQEILAETEVNGRPVLITRGEKTQDDITKLLEADGNQFSIPAVTSKFNPWAWRGTMSDIGQTLTLISGKYSAKGLDVPTIMFGASNFMANRVNKTFGGQKSEDTHQLRVLKTELGKKLGKYLPDGETLPAIDKSRAELRKEPQKPESFRDKFNGFMKKNSVRVGEIGLRYFGSIALAFPIKTWGTAVATLRNGSVSQAFQAAKNPDATGFYTGIAYLTGKTIGMFSKVPDPFNPKPATLISVVREKILFRLSTAIETGAAATLAIGRFTKGKITLPDKKFIPEGWRGKQNTDVIGGVGGLFLVTGLITRLFAKFGTREVHMDELNAYVTDSLAKVPVEQLPQAVAETAAFLKQHFKGQSPEFGQIYTRLSDQLYHYHNIAIAPDNEDANTRSTMGTRSLLNRVSAPEPAYAEKIRKGEVLASPSL